MDLTFFQHSFAQTKEALSINRQMSPSSSSSVNDLFIQSTNHKHDRSTLLPRMEYIFARILRKLYPDLMGTNAFILPLEGVNRKKYGDYACFNVMEICQEKRKQNPNLFDKEKPIHFARAIISALQIQKHNNMISKSSLRFRDFGVITFKLDGTWMAQMLKKMLHDGIDTLAPRIYEKKARAVFMSDHCNNTVRALCIIEALARMYLYSGLDVLAEEINYAEDPLFIMHIGHKHEADILVYVAPDFKREFAQSCFTYVKRGRFLEEATLSFCGVRSSTSYIEEKMYSLDYRDFVPKFASVFELAEAAGYTKKDFFACLIIYTCLKSHRHAECSFNMEDMLDEKGNTFVYVLKARALISSVIKNSRGACLFKSEEALAGKEERELGLHLMEFSGVIETAYSALVPNVVCEYLCNLSKLFTSYYQKVRPGKAAILGMCKATEVIMEKCFDLLGIAPGNSSVFGVFGFPSSKDLILSSARHDVPCREISEARNRHLKSRIEMFSMIVSVAHATVDEGYIFGTISVVDAFDARADGWTMSDEKDYCYVSYFNREWYEPLGMSNGSCIPIGDPSCRPSVPISSFLNVHVLLHATSKERDKCYKISCCNHDMELSEFWGSGQNAMCKFLKYDSDDGQVIVNYVLLREAVDAYMELKFSSNSNSNVPLQVSGSIIAYYGDGVVADDGGILGEFKAVIFEAKNFVLERKEALLKLHKSGLAVPANGCLKIVASLKDLKTQKFIVNEMREYDVSPGSTKNWKMYYGKDTFNLKVAWSF